MSNMLAFDSAIPRRRATFSCGDYEDFQRRTIPDQCPAHPEAIRVDVRRVAQENQEEDQ